MNVFQLFQTEKTTFIKIGATVFTAALFLRSFIRCNQPNNRICRYDPSRIDSRNTRRYRLTSFAWLRTFERRNGYNRCSYSTDYNSRNRLHNRCLNTCLSIDTLSNCRNSRDKRVDCSKCYRNRYCNSCCNHNRYF